MSLIKKTQALRVSAIALVFACLSVQWSYADTESSPDKDHGGPSPLACVHQKVQLESGQSYTLYGEIVIGKGLDGTGSQAYLRVDAAHQVLSTGTKRGGTTYYPIEGDLSFWQSYDHQVVKFPCEAEGRMIVGPDQADYYVIFLRPYTDRD